MSSIIQVQNLSKSFVISHEGKEHYKALRDVVATSAKKIFSFSRFHRTSPKTTREDFWALDDVSFDIEQGDRVAIIGRNGAGKSTLLKIISRITEPTKGTVKIKGRVASLLEVGTGFHPELSGRENIFLNGAILGMSKSEIRSKFDEIVDFAEIERFLDTPVKRYSSGMYVRLAFAVAAHLEPEILIIDEVLAVGDAQFQKKCLGKMEDVSKNEGRTVLFVSHNMNVIKSLCNNGILLSAGRIIERDNIDSLVSRYMAGAINEVSRVYYHKEGGKKIKIQDILVNGKKNPLIRINDGLTITIEYESDNFAGLAEFFLLFYNDQGDCIQGIFQEDENQYTEVVNGKNRIKVTLTNNFIPGTYIVSAGCFDRFRNFLDWVEHAERFEIDVLYSDNRVYKPRNGLLMSNKVSWQAVE